MVRCVAKCDANAMSISISIQNQHKWSGIFLSDILYLVPSNHRAFVVLTSFCVISVIFPHITHKNAYILRTTQYQSTNPSINQFPAQTNQHTAGCENCPFLDMIDNPERANACTSAFFEGQAALMDPRESWAAKWIRVDNYLPGVYALSITGSFDREIEEDLEARGIRWRCRPPPS